MECSLASNSSVSAANCISGSVKSSDKQVKTGLRVNFTEKGEVKERREKFLTAKYGSHQMNLIRKRLAVEMWLYEELQKLSSAACITKEVDIDIDELLDLDSDADRRKRIQDSMPELMNSVPDKVQKFTEELLVKMKTL